MTRSAPSLLPMALVGLVCTALGFGLALAFADAEGSAATPPTVADSTGSRSTDFRPGPREAERWTEQEQGHFTARSDSEGRFTIESLPSASFSAQAHRDGFVFRGEDLWNVYPGQRIELTGFAISYVDVEVRLPDGSAPTEAAVWVDDDEDDSVIRWTPDSTRIAITTREASVTAYAGLATDLPLSGLMTARYESDSETIADHPEGARLVLELEEQCGLFGWIEVPDGSMRAQFAKIAKVPDGTTPTAKWLEEANNDDVEWESVDSNYFLFTSLEPGLYAVGVGHTDGQVQAFTTVEINGGIARVELVQPADSDADYLRVLALDPDGRPVRSLEVTSLSNGPDGVDWNEPETLRKPDGSHWLRLAELANFDTKSWPNGATIALTVQSSKWGSESVELRPGQKEVQIQYRAPHALTVLVRGDGLEDSNVGVHRIDSETASGFPGRWGYGSDTRYDEVQSGRARFARLPPGEWEVFLLSTHSIRLAAQNVRIDASDVEIELVAPPTYELVVQVQGAVDGIGLQATRLGADGKPDESNQSYAQVEEDGRARFVGLPGGTYSLTSWDGQGDAKRVSVPSGEVLYEIKAVDCMLIAISDPEGRLAKAGLKAGDRVIRVNGTELTAESLWETGWAGLSEESCEVTVQRGAQTLTFRLEGLGSHIHDPAELGGSFIPATRK